MKFFNNKSSKSFMDTTHGFPPQEDNAFMACTLRLRRGSAKTLYKLGEVIHSTQGIQHFQMGKGGIIHMSGCVNANLLMYKLGKLGKYLEMLWWQHGQCSSYLDGPDLQCFSGVQSYPAYDGAPCYGRGYVARGMPGSDEGINRCSIM